MKPRLHPLGTLSLVLTVLWRGVRRRRRSIGCGWWSCACSWTAASWTIDAPYRETVEELRHYRQEGVLTVEMEAAAVFAIAELRGFEAAAAFVLSDVLSDVEWTPDFSSAEIQRGLTVLVDAATQILEAENTDA